jgi:hypothetical protein
MRVVGSLLEAAAQGDPTMGEDAENAEDANFAEPADDVLNDISDRDENEP